VRRKETNKEHIGASGYRAFLKSSLLFIIEVGIAKKSKPRTLFLIVKSDEDPFEILAIFIL
jgi:hypothetical protein